MGGSRETVLTRMRAGYAYWRGTRPAAALHLFIYLFIRINRRSSDGCAGGDLDGQDLSPPTPHSPPPSHPPRCMHTPCCMQQPRADPAPGETGRRAIDGGAGGGGGAAYSGNARRGGGGPAAARRAATRRVLCRRRRAGETPGRRAGAAQGRAGGGLAESRGPACWRGGRGPAMPTGGGRGQQLLSSPLSSRQAPPARPGPPLAPPPAGSPPLPGGGGASFRSAAAVRSDPSHGFRALALHGPGPGPGPAARASLCDGSSRTRVALAGSPPHICDTHGPGAASRGACAAAAAIQPLSTQSQLYRFTEVCQCVQLEVAPAATTFRTAAIGPCHPQAGRLSAMNRRH